MTTKIFILSILTIVIVGCKKDTYTTVPQLSLKSVSTTLLRPGNILTFKIEFTDKEGDIIDTLFIRKTTRNCAASTFTARYRVPAFTTTKNTKGEFEVSFDYNLGSGLPSLPGPQCPGRNDSCVFKFVLQDKARNKSDTLVSPEIVMTRN